MDTRPEEEGDGLMKAEGVALIATNEPETAPEERGSDVGILLEGSKDTTTPINIVVEFTKIAANSERPSEPRTVDVYILLLGHDCQDFTQYVEIVMFAKEYLGKMGYNVVGAFMSSCQQKSRR